VNEAKWSGTRWSEVQYRERGWGERVFMKKGFRSRKWWEVTDWGESVSELIIVKKIQETVHSTVLFGCIYLLYMLYSNLSRVFFLLVLSCLLCKCCWLTVCIVVVVLCVLLSYVYLLYCVCIAVFYIRCQTAGLKSVFGRSCDRPSRHRFFLVSLCLKAKAEMVPKIPSCHYMFLM